MAIFFQLDSKDDAYQQVKFRASGGDNQPAKIGASDCIDKGAENNDKTGSECLACFPSSKNFTDEEIVQEPSKTNKFFARFKGSCCDKLKSKILLKMQKKGFAIDRSLAKR